MTRRQTLAPLREPNFRYYFLSRLVDRAGTTMAGVALAFAVLEVSDSATALGTVLAAYSIPMVIFILAGGVLADRFGRTLVMQSTNVASAVSQLAMAALVITDTAELWHMVVLAALNGTATAAGMPAMAGILPQLVPREQLKEANLLLAVPENALMVLGPAISGVLVVTIGPGWALAVDGATYLAATLLLALVQIPPPLPREEKPGVLADLREGWTYLTSTTWLWVVVASFGLLNAITAGAFNTLGPVLAIQSDIGESGWGLIRSAQAVGFLVCSLVTHPDAPAETAAVGHARGVARGRADDRPRAWSPCWSPPWSPAFVAGFGVQVFGLGWDLAMQEHVPDEMLSRAYSYDMLGSFVAIPVGQLAFGPLAILFGVQKVMLVGRDRRTSRWPC